MRRPTSSLLIVAIAAATVIAACGSNSPSRPSVSRSGGRLTQAQKEQATVNFADCMRSHGVTNLPDPASSPHEIKPAMNPNSTLTRSPQFQAAATACQHLLPDGSLPTAAHSHAQIAAFLAFAHCMRTHGFPNFPDPTSSGELTPQMLANAGINLHQPAVPQAGDACVGVTHGVITKAAVAGFVAGQ
jgi:hypothetical protein